MSDGERPTTFDRLTNRQRAVLLWLVEHGSDAPDPLSLDAVCAGLGLTSRGSLHKHVQALVAAGFVQPLRGRQRGLALTEAGRRATRTTQQTLLDDETPASRVGSIPTLPLLGRVAAGRPIEAIEQEERIEIGAEWAARADHYALIVRGDSMIEEGIHDGDIVVVEHRTSARNGELVIALIDGTEATLKRFEQRAHEIVLHPANSTMLPLVFRPEQVTIRGAVKGLIRRYG
ncbi:MAG: transcriptional repressor LexA [Proteobacteria bacterium]|nr:transcriptional repressor LexA [Burkholderiales bacterium]